MRVRTEERRRAILEAAAEVFREHGYERASMSMITARVGGSKATLYGYFASKEELFAAAMVEAMREQGESAIALLNPEDPDPMAVLERFGLAYIRLISSPISLASSRASIAEAAQQKLGELFYALGPKSILDAISEYMAHLATRGLIDPASVRLAAIQFHGLLDAGTLIPLLMGARTELKPKEVAHSAVETIVKAHFSRSSK